MSATDELRRLLGERGVEYRWDNGTVTWYMDGVMYNAWGYDNERLTMSACHLTPAQAIAATLGTEDTYTHEDVEGAFVSGYSLGLDMSDSSKSDGEKGWNQNERNLDEEMAELGWVRDTGTCHAVETESMSCSCNDVQLYYGKWITGLPLTVHIMECSECGGTYEHVNGSYEFCPRCGRKVVDE